MQTNFRPRGKNSELNRPGVYQLRCLVDGTVYVGGTTHLRKRLEGHRNRLRVGKHRNRKLQAAWDQFGEGAFRCEPLLFCAENMVHFYEQRALDASQSVYNLSKTSATSSGYSMPDSAKRRLSAARTSIFVIHNGEQRSLKSVCDELGVGYKGTWRRYKEQGVPFPECLQPRRVDNVWVIGGPSARRG